MSDENVPVEFPSYTPPAGIPIAGKNAAPLMKMAKTMMKLRHPKMAVRAPIKTKPHRRERYY